AEVRVGGEPPLPASASWAADDPTTLVVDLDGAVRRYRYAEADGVAWLSRDGATWALRESERLDVAGGGEVVDGELTAPMPGTVAVVSVREGERVRAGQALLVVEAMKMEHPITAPVDGVVTAVHVRAGDQVAMDQPLAVVSAQDAQEEAR
ncbi:MAG TPA: biotin/lipoyl-containing protein, partial [Egibacteraceae bacterium]